MPASIAPATCASLVLDLKGQLGAIQTAEFRQNVNFRDGDMKASADLAVHDETAGTLLLTPAKGAKKGPWVDDGTVHVDAMWIQVDLATHDLRAKEKVQAKMTQGKAASGAETHTPALFEADQPVYGTGTALNYVSASKSASFTGDASSPANVYQTDGKNKIRATQRIDVQQESGNLQSLGRRGVRIPARKLDRRAAPDQARLEGDEAGRRRGLGKHGRESPRNDLRRRRSSARSTPAMPRSPPPSKDRTRT